MSNKNNVAEMTVTQLVGAVKAAGKPSLDVTFEDVDNGETVAVIVVYGTKNVQKLVKALDYGSQVLEESSKLNPVDPYFDADDIESDDFLN